MKVLTSLMYVFAYLKISFKTQDFVMRL